MPEKSQHALIYQSVPKLLLKMRTDADMTQRDLAAKVKKSQPWVHKSEIGERRVDIAEFVEWSVACGIDPLDACRKIISARKL